MSYRKRARSSTRTTTSVPASKVPRLKEAHSDDTGTDFRMLLDSMSSSNLLKYSVRDRVKKTIFNIKGIFLSRNREQECVSATVACGQGPSVVVDRTEHSETALASVPDTMTQLGCHDHSRSIIVSEDFLDKTEQSEWPTIGPCAACEIPVVPPDFDGATSDCTALETSFEPPLNIACRTSSAYDLLWRVSQKFHKAAGSLTIIHRPEANSRYSIDEIPLLEKCQYQSSGSSSPSTGQADSDSNRGEGPRSKPPTSDNIRMPPTSTASNSYPTQISSSAATSQSVPMHFLSILNPVQPLIANTDHLIRTAEVTAHAKIYLESYYDVLLNREQDRDLRRRRLEERLRVLELPTEISRRARTMLSHLETNRLRCHRAQQNWQRSQTCQKGLSIADFEIIKVLGKGSFGVVRLVRERPCDGSSSDQNAAQQGFKLSATSSLIKQAITNTSPICPRLRQDTLRRNRQVYAMKVIHKSYMLRYCQEGHLKAERDLLVAAEGSRWIVSLHAAFQDDKYLYLVMDYYIGGDFLSLLFRQEVLCEEVTKWYIAEMILCVEEAHCMNWIHRDVKPENFLIGADGHLKIADFGLAFDGGWQHNQKYLRNQRESLLDKLGIRLKGNELDQDEQQRSANSCRVAKVINNSVPRYARSQSQEDPRMDEPLLDWRNRVQRRRLAKSVVGTSQYMAPEIILGELYDGRCDWWSIGVIMYECLYGYTPFASTKVTDTKINIIKHCCTLEFPEVLNDCSPSECAVDLMKRLLTDKDKRLSTGRYALDDMTRYSESKDLGHFVYSDDAEDIRNHPWLRGVPWDTLHLQKPPFVPRVKNWEDTKYFDNDESIQGIVDVDSEEHSLTTMTRGRTGEQNKDLPPGNLSQSNLQQPECEYTEPSAALQSTATAYGAQPPAGNIPAKPRTDITVPPVRVDGDVQWIKQQLEGPTAPVNQGVTNRQEKDNERARDKILRDKACAATALEIRKRIGFLGYE